MHTATSKFLFAVARNLVVKSVGIPAGFLCTVLLANHLGSTLYGEYTLLISVATVLIAGINRIYSVLLVREIAAAITLKKTEYINGIFIFCIVVAIPLVALLHYWPSGFSLLSADADPPSTLLILLMLSVVLIGSALRGLHYTTLGLFVEQVGRPVFQLVILVFIGGIIWRQETLSADFALKSLLLALLISAIVGMTALIYQAHQAKLIKWPAFKRSWLVKGVPTLLILGYLGGINMQLPVLLLGKFSSSSEIAQYKVAISISSLIGVTLLTVNMALGPRLSSLKAKNDLVNYEHRLRQACTLVVYLAIPLAIMFSLFSDYIILRFFDSDYNGATHILWICCLAQVINCFCGPVALAFNMLDREATNISAILLSIVVGLVSGIFLIPEYGAWGAAITSVLTTISWNLFLVIRLKSLFNITSLPYINPVRAFLR